MPTDIFIVRITPSTGMKSGKTFPWIKISRLDRRRKTPKPKLKILESGYKEVEIENKLGVPETKTKLKRIAAEVGMAIFKESKNSKRFAK